jgi:hypothetical protein
MLPNRSLLLATACALPLSLVACGGGDDGGGGAAGPPTGTHYGYVVNKATVAPTQAQSAVALGLDLGSGKDDKLDGKVDNQLGLAIGSLSTLGFDVQGTVNTAINTGAIILLIDFQTPSFTSSTSSGFTVKFGSNPTPPACADANDTTCGGHLKGTATIAVADDSPTDAAVAGKIVNGTFSSDAGNIGLAITLGDAATPISLNLVHARVKASTITADGIVTANIGGLITQDELKTNVAPAILNSVNNLLTAAGCSANGTPPGCGCIHPTTATGIILGQIDGDIDQKQDCKITVDELLSFSAVQTVLTPDSCSQASCASPDSLSIGVQVTAVKATIQ